MAWPYGVPHGRGANLLLFNTDVVTPAPDSWSVVWDCASPYAGKVTAYDYPIYIADAAVVPDGYPAGAGHHQPLRAGRHPVRRRRSTCSRQQSAISPYWVDCTNQIEHFQSGDTVLGTTWQIIADMLQPRTPPDAGRGDQADRGGDRLVRHLMINSKTKNPNCAYAFMNHITSARGECPDRRMLRRGARQLKSCALREPGPLRHLPRGRRRRTGRTSTTGRRLTAECLDGRTDVTCKGFDEWITAWTEIKG